MRIIAGERRGRRIEGPSDEQTRPTSDRVREAIFNILAGRLEDAHVYDLFAGSGALGLESLSRGAAKATFVEINRENVRLIHRNAETLDYRNVCKVTLADAHRFGRSFAPEPGVPSLIFLDPPYVEYQRHVDKISDLIASLGAKCEAGSTLVVESGKHWDENLLPDRENWDIRRYGGTAVAFRFFDNEITMADEQVQDQEANDDAIAIDQGEE